MSKGKRVGRFDPFRSFWILPGLMAVAASGQSLDTYNVLLTGADPAARTIHLDTGCSAPGGRQWRATVDPPTALGEWLSLSPSGGPAAHGIVDIAIGAHADALPVGTYAANIQFTSASDCDGLRLSTPLDIGLVTVILEIALDDATPHRLTPATITLNAVAGGPPVEGVVTFDTVCDTVIGRDWTASAQSTGDWLSVTPDSDFGTTSATELRVIADPADVLPGEGPLSGTITVLSTDCLGEDPDNPQPHKVNVILQLVSSDEDADEDAIPDEIDNCPVEFNPTQEDGDSDGMGDLCDDDRDGDDVPNDDDNCPDVANTGQDDSDEDAIGDACDGCPENADRTDPEPCGCDADLTDSDGDGTPDCADGCPDDADKIEDGQCGCGEPDIDADEDGFAACVDLCPRDPDKIEPRRCGCGEPETDTDGDQAPDCVDDCPLDPGKISPGQCGCGTAENDDDSDGVALCFDDCANTPNGEEVDAFGCAASERDGDRDGTVDALDRCLTTPLGQPVDALGCAVFELDSDNDGLNDAIDQCPRTPPGRQVDLAGCALPDTGNEDRDYDGVVNRIDRCEDTPFGVAVDELGCMLDAADDDTTVRENTGPDTGQAPAGMCGATSASSLLLMCAGLLGMPRRRRMKTPPR